MMAALDLFGRAKCCRAFATFRRETTIVAFQERFVEADGFRIRYMEAGDGPPLVHLHGAGGLRLNAGARSAGADSSA